VIKAQHQVIFDVMLALRFVV